MDRTDFVGELPGVPAGRRRYLIEQLIEVMPAVKRRIVDQLGGPDHRGQLASVTPHQADALCLLARDGDMTMNDLARVLNVAMSTATALADRLVKQGLAERVANPTDRRVVRLAATPLARETIRRHQEGRRAAAVATLSILDERELDALLHILSKVATGNPAPTVKD
jgi:DNA-binding MarR family transcriptional regulator